MASDEEKWRYVDHAEDKTPDPKNLVVSILASHGIPYERIHGKESTGDDFIKDIFPPGKLREKYKERFKDYIVVMYGVSSEEGLPRPPLSWQSGGKEFDSWQIQIKPKAHYGWVEATLNNDPRTKGDYIYVVQTMWGILEDVRKYRRQIFRDLMEGMKLLLKICSEILKFGRPAKWSKDELIEKIKNVASHLPNSKLLTQPHIAKKMKELYNIESDFNAKRLSELCRRKGIIWDELQLQLVAWYKTNKKNQ